MSIPRSEYLSSVWKDGIFGGFDPAPVSPVWGEGRVCHVSLLLTACPLVFM